MTYYDILNVSEDATLKDIKQSYYKLAHKYHPDKNNGDDTSFKRLSVAYETLSDQEKRRQYDFKLRPMDSMMYRPRFGGFNMNHPIFKNNIPHSVSISTIIENGVRKTRKVTTRNGIVKVEIFEEPLQQC